MLYHYTDRNAAQLIMISGTLNGDADGNIWFSPTMYTTGASARRGLAIPHPDKAVVVRIGIPEADILGAATVVHVGYAESSIELDGVPVTPPGTGVEVKVTSRFGIPTDNCDVHALDVP